MRVDRLRTFCYRNLEDTQVDFDPESNFICGRNGQGKTNILEALALLSSGRSFRTSNVRELIRKPEKSAAVSASVQNRLGRCELTITIDGPAKNALVDGKKVTRFTDYHGRLTSVSFVPADVELVRGAPSERRAFLDKHCVDIKSAHLAHLSAYQRAHRHKNFLLKSGVTNEVQYQSWNALLAQSGVAILRARRELVAKISEEISELSAEFMSSDGALSLQMSESIRDIESPEEFEKKLNEELVREIRQGYARLGPHRDDLEINLGQLDARAFASQGQARSLVLLMKIAVAKIFEREHAEPPIILLDDIDSELDSERYRGLIDLLLSKGRQVFITSTERRSLRPHSGKTIEVHAGTLKSA